METLENSEQILSNIFFHDYFDTIFKNIWKKFGKLRKNFIDDLRKKYNYEEIIRKNSDDVLGKFLRQNFAEHSWTYRNNFA